MEPTSATDAAREADRDPFDQAAAALPWLAPTEVEEPVARRGRAPLPVAAAVAAVWAALCSYAPILVLTIVGTMGTGAKPIATARLAANVWLLAHGVPLQTPADRLTLVPLALTALAGWRLVRAGVHASRATGAHRARSVWPVLGAGVAVGLAAGLFAVAVAAIVRTPTLTAEPVRAGLVVFAGATLAATLGAVRHSKAGRRAIHRAPALLADAIRTGLATAALVVAAGAASAGVALALAGGDAASMLASYGAGAAGQVGLTALCLVYLPNIAVWGAAYLLGPGFAFGAGTVVSPSDVLLGPLPGLPILAAVPSAPLSGLAPALLGAPLLAGIAAGLLLGRRPGTDRRWSRRLTTAGLSALVTGVVVQLAVWVSAGALGSGRLAAIGPHGFTTGLYAVAVSGVGLVLGTLLAAAMPARRS